MSKAYNSRWSVKQLNVNFNQKQWRQDFGAYVKNKLFWRGLVLVTRSKAKSKTSNLKSTKGSKTFEVYNGYGGSVIVTYQKENEVLYTSHDELIEEYFEKRNR